jgi:hypothetical protein
MLPIKNQKVGRFCAALVLRRVGELFYYVGDTVSTKKTSVDDATGRRDE